MHIQRWLETGLDVHVDVILNTCLLLFTALKKKALTWAQAKKKCETYQASVGMWQNHVSCCLVSCCLCYMMWPTLASRSNSEYWWPVRTHSKQIDVLWFESYLMHTEPVHCSVVWTSLKKWLKWYQHAIILFYYWHSSWTRSLIFWIFLFQYLVLAYKQIHGYLTCYDKTSIKWHKVTINWL